MRLTELASFADGRWHCGVCQWGCQLAPGETGRCQMRTAQDDGIAVLNDGAISAASVTGIEDHRLWHLLPGSTVLSLGGWGYAFPADQARGPYAHLPEDPAKVRLLPAERAAQFALDRLCRGVVWAFNDPSVTHEYMSDLLRLARANSRYTALVTSGYLTPAALGQIGHYLDAISLDLRGFDDAAYARLAGVEHWRGILEVVATARSRWNCHVEVTTRMHHGVNDSPESVAQMAQWIATTLGRDTPWHILPGDAGAEAAAAVVRARRAGNEAGLRFLYSADLHQDTTCPKCGTTVIERNDQQVRVVGLEEGGCTRCGEDLHIRTSIFKR